MSCCWNAHQEKTRSLYLRFEWMSLSLSGMVFGRGRVVLERTGVFGRTGTLAFVGSVLVSEHMDDQIS